MRETEALYRDIISVVTGIQKLTLIIVDEANSDSPRDILDPIDSYFQGAEILVLMNL